MSDRKKASAEIRNARTIPGAVDELSSGARRKKDKKRWCKGKIGVEHLGVCTIHKLLEVSEKNIFSDWRELVCTRCGKILDRYYPMTKKSPKPTWVLF